jgi:hypothetical protein
MSELLATKQEANERAADFITRWRNLSIHCSQVLDQREAVKLCMSNLLPWLAFGLQGVAPTTFEALSTKATDSEVFLMQNPQLLASLKGAAGITLTDKQKKTATKNVTIIDVKGGEKQLDNKGKQMKGKAIVFGEENEAAPSKKIISLEERRNKQYPFRNDKIGKLFTQALASGTLQLPTPKKPEEVDKVDNPNYCPYHRCLGHKIEDCWVFKDWILKEYNEKRITLSPKVLKDPQVKEANVIQAFQQVGTQIDFVMEEEMSSSDDDEGWTTVSRKHTSAKSSKHSIQSNNAHFLGGSTYRKKKKNQSKLKSNKSKVTYGPTPLLTKEALEKMCKKEDEEYVQKERTPVLLEEFMPKDWDICASDNDDESPAIFGVYVVSVDSGSDDETLYFPDEEIDNDLQSCHMTLRGGIQSQAKDKIK